MADSLRLSQIVSNLLSNACKYSPAGASIMITAKEQDRFVRLGISDTGVGIAQDDLPHLFSKFFHCDNSSTREVSGTGLGLFITKHLVEAHGGRLEVESQEGIGSTFSFSMPVAVREAATPPATAYSLQMD